MSGRTKRSVLKRVMRAWAVVGTTAFVVFTVWALLSYRASPVAKRAARSDSTVEVRHESGAWLFLPAGAPRSSTGFLFVAGSLVDPRAYAPLARATAERGYPSYVVELPRRGAFGGATEPSLLRGIRARLRDTTIARRWVVGGHSRGGVVVSTLLATDAPNVAGVVLIGTSHPRDVDLSGLRLPVTKVVATRDGLATPARVEANRALLPPSTRWVRIDGGNHSHFGWYGFQPGDRRATVPAAVQRRIMVDAVLDALRAAVGLRAESGCCFVAAMEAERMPRRGESANAAVEGPQRRLAWIRR